MDMNLFSINEIKISYISNGLGPVIKSAQDVFDMMIPNWLDIDYSESFHVILLNRANRTLGVCRISLGSVSGTVADPKKIFQTALKANASGIILCHNHPSCNVQPSASDRAITKKCVEAGKFLDLPVLDHIILTRENYYSFADEGLL